MLLSILLVLVFVIALAMWSLSRDNSALKTTKRTFTTDDGEDYTIYEIENVLTPKQCALIRDAAEPFLERSSVTSDENTISDVRTSYGTFLKTGDGDEELVEAMTRVDTLAAFLSGKPVTHQEDMQVVRYEPDQFYKCHYDECDDSSNACQRSHEGGFRHSTLLVYLNDVDQGGYTEFPKLGYQVKPKLGSVVFFRNLENDEKTVHELSLHGGVAPVGGVKWACNKWIRTEIQ